MEKTLNENRHDTGKADESAAGIYSSPVFIGNVFQQFYNMVDAVVVGKFVGTKALAAVGSTGTIIF
ncbi:MAG: MATE family efflux transporter [Ruminococcus sp.]